MTRDLSTPPVILAGSLAGSPQPVLPVAQGLLLRPWGRGDAPVFLSAYQDEDIRRWHTRRPSSEARVREWFDGYRQDWEQEKGGHWAVARDNGGVLGRIALRSVDLDGGTASVGYWVLPRSPRRRHRHARPLDAHRLGPGPDRLPPPPPGPLNPQPGLMQSRHEVRLPAGRHQTQCRGA